MRRRTSETRQLLLDTGVEMLYARGVTAGVAHIRLSDVVRRAGLTTGAAYRIWDDQDDFHRDLAVAAIRWRDRKILATTVAAIRKVVDAGGDLGEVIRLGAGAHIAGLDDGPTDGDTVAGPPTFLTSIALRASTDRQGEVRDAALDHHRELVTAYADLYRGLMARYRRRMIPPLTIEHLAAAIAALGEGFALQVNEGERHPMLLDQPEPVTLFARSISAIVDAFTAPMAAADPDPATD